MAIDLESDISAQVDTRRSPGWLKVGAVAAASALAGGLAAAWYYRHTLARLRQAEEHAQHPVSGISGNISDNDT
jgi:hypothetical protein